MSTIKTVVGMLWGAAILNLGYTLFEHDTDKFAGTLVLIFFTMVATGVALEEGVYDE